jgi:hypothetical protein
MRHLVKCLAAVVLLTTPGSVWGNGPDARAAFERLKQLAGAWLATAGDGKGAATSFEIIGGGSTIVEKYRDPRMGPGNEMVTMYHLDGARLLLTHYCMAKNQPRMQLTFFDPATGELRFEFLDATNLASPGAGHMHSARYTLENPDRFTTVWDFVKDGKVAYSETQHFTRSR